MIRIQTPQIRDTDAEPLRSTYNPLQEAMGIERMKEEKAYRGFESQLSLQRLLQGQERLKMAQQKEGKDDFLADMSKLNAATKGLPGGVFYKQLSSKIDDLRSSMTDYYKQNGVIPDAIYVPQINEVVEGEAKAKALNGIHDTLIKGLAKSYPIKDAKGLDNLVTRDLFYSKDKNGKYSLGDIYQMDPEKIATQLESSPEVMNFVDVPTVVSTFLKKLGTVTESNSSTSGGPLGSHLHSVATTAIKYGSVDPRTGQLVIGSMPDNEESRMAVGDNLSVAPVVNKPLYEAALGDPSLRNLMNMAVGQINQKRGSDKQIPINSTEADYIRRRWLYKQMIPETSSKISTRNSSHITKSGELAKSGDANMYKDIFDSVKNGDYANLDKYGLSTVDLPIPGGPPRKAYDMTGLFDKYKGLLGPDMHVTKAYAPVDEPGKILVQISDVKGHNKPQLRYLSTYEMNQLAIDLTKQNFGEPAARGVGSQIDKSQENTVQKKKRWRLFKGRK
ncbi:MAG: hypothetical protein ACREHG_10025 [Candidatus Saccharimonadales bacterium]